MLPESMRASWRVWLVTGLLSGGGLLARAAEDPSAHVPASAPRTVVLRDQRVAFRAYCTTGEGAKAFAKIKADFDRDYLRRPFPPEPLTYGDP